MSDILKIVSKILFYALVLALFVWTSSLTVSLAFRLFPNDAITPYFVLALFDFGALAWLLVFLKNASGLAQRAISVLAFALDLVGVMFCAFAELFLGGQELTAIPEGLGTYVVWAVGIYTIINLASAYAFHITDPGELAEIRMQTLQDKVEDEAMRQVEARITEQAADLADHIQKRLYITMMARLALPINTNDRAYTGPVIDGTANDVPEKPAASRRMFFGGRKFAKPQTAFASEVEAAPGEVASTGNHADQTAASTGNEDPTPARTKRR